MDENYLGRRALKTYVRVRASSSNAARVRAWAETVRYRIYILGVTDMTCTCAVGAHREIVYGGRHAGQDGQGGAKRKRVETPLVEPCALRGASERGQGDVRKLARLVRIEPQSQAKD